MQTKINNQNTFKGYDARSLKGLFVTSRECQRELSRVLRPFDVDVFTPQIESKSVRKEFASLESQSRLLWTQDYFTFLKDKAVLFDFSREHLQRVFRACADGIKKQMRLEPFRFNPHIRGGNFFICDVNGTKKLLINNDHVLFPDYMMKEFYDSDKICQMPKLNYHIDLFLRPLDNGNVLVADNKATVNSLNNLATKFQSYIEQNKLSEEETKSFEEIIEQIKLALMKFDITEQFDRYKPRETTEQVVDQLKQYGFNPIRVPGNYYYLDKHKSIETAKKHLSNFKANIAHAREFSKTLSLEDQKKFEGWVKGQELYMKDNPAFGVEFESFYNQNFVNAITFKDKNGKIVYITNAPLFDRMLGITPEIEERTGLSMRNEFIESIAPYVDRENIHFISDTLTEKLFKYTGGVHCTAAEIP